jgi:phage-related protein
MPWPVDFYRDSNGTAPVELFLDRLNSKHRAKLLALITMLKEYGVALPFPYSTQVKGRLRELRTQFGKTRLRILYFADANQQFQLLHAVVKDTQKLEQSDVAIGEHRMADHNVRLKKSKTRGD